MASSCRMPFARETPENWPAIIVSTDDWTAIDALAKKTGVNACLPKPVFKSYLVNVIYAVLVNETENREPVRKTGMEMPRFEGRKILLVEDNELNQEIATELIAMTRRFSRVCGKRASRHRKIPEIP